MSRTPDTYTRYETDYRDPETVATMAMIDQMEKLNRNLAFIGGQLERMQEVDD